MTEAKLTSKSQALAQLNAILKASFGEELLAGEDITADIGLQGTVRASRVKDCVTLSMQTGKKFQPFIKLILQQRRGAKNEMAYSVILERLPAVAFAVYNHDQDLATNVVAAQQTWANREASEEAREEALNGLPKNVSWRDGKFSINGLSREQVEELLKVLG